MLVRPIATVVATVLLTASLAACSSTATPSSATPGATSSPTATAPTPTASPTGAPTTSAPSSSPSPTPTRAVTIRPIGAGYDLPGIANALRSGLKTWASMSDDEIAIALNAGCDGIDATGTPIGGADAIRAYGPEPGDAAFGLLAAISAYCPEYTKFLGGS